MFPAPRLCLEPNRPVSTAFFSNLYTAGYKVKKERRSIELKEHMFSVNIYEVKRVEKLFAIDKINGK